MFGFISANEVRRLLEAERRRHATELEEMEKRFKRTLRDIEAPAPIQQIHLSDGYVTKEELLRELVAGIDSKMEGIAKAAVGKLDVDALTNAVYQDIDNDDVIEKLVEVLKDKMYEDIDRKEVAKVIAETLCEEGFDDDFIESLAGSIAERLEIVVRRDS